MARNYSAATRSTTAGTAARPVGSLFAIASRSGALREVGVFNTTAVACAFRLARCTAAGTPGATVTAVPHQSADTDTADMTAKADHSADATVSSASIRQFSLGAAIGSGVILTFDPPIFIPAGTANGVGIVPVGTGQLVDWFMEWSE